MKQTADARMIFTKRIRKTKRTSFLFKKLEVINQIVIFTKMNKH